jgi:alkylation response protein AidB-like acyl-CoA dehydrogenase
MNFFTDNEDIQFHFRQGVGWDRFVPLWEEGFRFEDGPRTLDEARELYEETLREAGEYAGREIAPTAREIDAQGVSFAEGRVVHPPALLRNIEGLKKLGVMGLNLPRDLGGANFPFSASTFLFEILSRACTNTMLLYAFYQGPAVPIARFGTREQKERWVPRLASGEISGSVAMTEPDAGSDVGNVSTAAVPEGGHWRVTGRKQFITNGCGDVSVVLARTEPGSKGLQGLSMLVVPRVENGRDNFRVARPETKMVIRGSATCELSFESSCAELLGPRGAGFAQILTFMNEARMAVAIQGLGIAEAAAIAARAYAERRVQMGKPIARHEMVADMLLDMETEVAALRALVYRCVQLQDRILGLERAPAARGRDAELAVLRRALRDRTPVLKWFGSERPLWVARTAVQVHGGYGVVQDYDVERHYRDALILPIYEGTSQIQALMSLKDQSRWVGERPWRLLAGAVSVEAPSDVLGDGVRDLASEYNRTLRHVLGRSGAYGAMAARIVGRHADPSDERLAFARRHAERLLAMLAYTRAAEALAAHAVASPRHRRLAERFVSRALPLLRMHGEVVRSGEGGVPEAGPA